MGDGDRSWRTALDEEPFAFLAKAHLESLYRSALTITRDHATAEELVQETFVRALEHAGQVLASESPLAWLRRVLYNLAMDRFRRQGREELVDEVEARWRSDAYTVDSDVVLERLLDREELQDALIHLPFPYRSAVILHDVEGLTVRELADMAGISLPAAKQRLRRGRMSLVEQMASGTDRRVALRGVTMRCWDARRAVSDYVDGLLDPPTCSGLERHLATCPTCPPLYASLVGVKAALGRLRDRDSVIPPGLAEKVRHHLDPGQTGEAG